MHVIKTGGNSPHHLNLGTSPRGFRISSSSPKFQSAMELISSATVYKVSRQQQNPNSELEKTVEGADDMSKHSLFLTSPPQIDIQSNFGPLFAMDPKKLKLAYEITGTLNGNHGATFESLSAFGFQAWEGSQPLRITVELKFFKGMWGWNDALNEVFNPVALLCETVLPTEGPDGVLISPSPNYYVGLTQLLQTYTTIGSNLVEAGAGTFGASLDWLFDTDGNIKSNITAATQKLTSKISSIIVGFASKRSQSRGTYNLKFGAGTQASATSMEYYNYICEQASPSFSLEVDEQGYPIWATLRLVFASVFSANVSHFPMHFPG